MRNTWASGTVELLTHADSHLKGRTAFDNRISFISVDNAVETMMRVFLSMPESKSGVLVKRSELEETENSFPKLLSLFMKKSKSRLTGIDADDIEHYHRIRNKLYHDGTGLSVDDNYLKAYRQIAGIILESLFGVTNPETKREPTLEYLIFLWNSIEKEFKYRLSKVGISKGFTFYPEMAMKEGIITQSDFSQMTELRMIRNEQVHSTELNPKKIEYAIEIAENLLKKLR